MLKRKNLSRKVGLPRSRKITFEWLEKHGACDAQVNTFYMLHPTGLELSKKNIILLAKQNFPITWALYRFVKNYKNTDWYEKTLSFDEQAYTYAAKKSRLNSADYWENLACGRILANVKRAKLLCEILGID